MTDLEMLLYNSLKGLHLLDKVDALIIGGGMAFCFGIFTAIEII